ncbi:diphosphomevalonate decarboxylase [Coelomomyces lativittatus]|nr:diphosphomevalonate decarboxylase [Coelomomyces lativittatus]KAJ1516770.1 diphosphomevalonate decarboxylase [Coelomomyces lativittatus]
MMIHEVTCTAPVNIAVIKYWGKRNIQLNLPTNGSMSITLSQDSLHTKTSIRCDPQFHHTRFWLNGIEEQTLHPKLSHLLHLFKQLRQEKEKKDILEKEEKVFHHSMTSSSPSLHSSTSTTTTHKKMDELSTYPLHIVSENNFPTAAGLASSASGYAALVYALTYLYELQDTLSLTQLSRLARLGSGSACRSLFGGFVVWDQGVLDNGDDSQARCLVSPTPSPSNSASHPWFSNLDIFVCVVQDTKKSTPSTLGMQQTVSTSTLHSYRCQVVVPERLKKMEKAILEHDYSTFVDLTIQDSNQFHATCLDTYPPIFYLNDTSKLLIQLVTDFNLFYSKKTTTATSTSTSTSTTTPVPSSSSTRSHASVDDEENKTSPPTNTKVAYTFDAGPNAVFFVPTSVVPDFMTWLLHCFPAPPNTPLDTYVQVYTPLSSTSSTSTSTSTSTLSSSRRFLDPRLPPDPSSSSSAEGMVSTQVKVQPPGTLKRILHTKIGDGPRVLAVGPSSEISLINKDGYPHRIRD